MVSPRRATFSSFNPVHRSTHLRPRQERLIAVPAPLLCILFFAYSWSSRFAFFFYSLFFHSRTVSSISCLILGAPDFATWWTSRFNSLPLRYPTHTPRDAICDPSRETPFTKPSPVRNREYWCLFGDLRLSRFGGAVVRWKCKSISTSSSRRVRQRLPELLYAPQHRWECTVLPPPG